MGRRSRRASLLGLIGIAPLCGVACQESGTCPEPEVLVERIVSEAARDGNKELYTMNPDGTDVKRLTTSVGDDSNPAWSLDGKKIVFHTNRDGNNEIYVM